MSISLSLATLASAVWLVSAFPDAGVASDWAEKVFKDPEDCLIEGVGLYYDIAIKSIVFQNLLLPGYTDYFNKNIKQATCGTPTDWPSATLEGGGTVFGFEYYKAVIPVAHSDENVDCNGFYMFLFNTRYKAMDLQKIIYKNTGKKLKIYKSSDDYDRDQNSKEGYILQKKSESVYVCRDPYIP